MPGPGVPFASRVGLDRTGRLAQGTGRLGRGPTARPGHPGPPPGSPTPGIVAATAGFQNSYVIATTIRPVTLASITAENGGTKFGFIARETLAGLTVTAPTQKFKFDPTQPSPQGLPGWDFQAVDLDGPD